MCDCLPPASRCFARTQLDLAQARILDLERRVREAQSMTTGLECSARSPRPERRAIHESPERGAHLSKRLALRVCSTCARAGHASPKRVYTACSLLSAAAYELASRQAKVRGGRILDLLAGAPVVGASTETVLCWNEEALDAPWIYVEAGGTSFREGQPPDRDDRGALPEDGWHADDWYAVERVGKR